MSTPTAIQPPVNEDMIMGHLREIMDPEIPVLSIVDLGIVRQIMLQPTNDTIPDIEVIITSTYTGCPAMDMIATQIRVMLASLGFKHVKVTQSISPAWTTDWITEHGKQQLAAYGIAPPDKRFNIPADGVRCPRCGSTQTRLLSEFGSTACKSLYQCSDCQEPFDYFKCH